MKYVVLGAGLQGPALAHALSMKVEASQGKVFICEIDKPRADRAKWLFKKLSVNLKDDQGVTLIKLHEGQPPLDLFHKEADLAVISTLPYHLNVAIANECLKRCWRYYDLGGHVQVSEEINRIAMDHNSPVPIMTDLGLAPGLVNVIAEHSIDQVKKPHALLMRCGGLPTNPKVNNLGYNIVFSAQGLINEYFNDCEALEDGKIKSIAPMGDMMDFQWRNYLYESFNTSGGAHTTLEYALERGLTNARYQTFRYVGHASIMRFLKHDIGMTDKQLVKLFEEKIGMTTEDKVIISVRCAGENGIWVWEDEILHDNYLTAMQRATGFSAASMVLATQDIYDKPVLTYRDCPAPKVFENLQGLLEIKL